MGKPARDAARRRVLRAPKRSFDVRSRGLKATPQCRFIAQYIARHEKEHGELVAD